MGSNVRVISMLVLLAATSLMGTNGQAAPVCGTLDECVKLLAELKTQQAQVEARIQDLLGQASNLGDIVRNSDGSVRYMNQYDADTYCKSQGTRLPTARELALYSQSLGAQGISATEKDGYYLVKGSDSAGNPDLFYFNYEGYQRPTGDLGSHFFWSSSVHPYYSNFAYYLDGYSGYIDYAYRSYGYSDGAVRCVRSR